MQEKFYENLVLFLRSYYKDSIVVFTDSLSYNRHFVVLTSGLTVDVISHVRKIYDDAVAFNVADRDKYLITARESVQKKIDNEEMEDVPNVPDDVSQLQDEDFIKLLNRTRGIRKGVRKSHVTNRPFMFLDVDLKDQLDVLKDQKIIKQDMTLEELNTHIKGLNNEKKIEMINKIMDLDVVWEETDPNLLVFSGNGIHIWYTMPLDSKYSSRKYHMVYKSVMEQVASLCPYIKFDESCADINRNMRLPYTLNRKNVIPGKVEILKANTLKQSPSIIRDSFALKDTDTDTTTNNDEEFGADSFISDIINLNSGSVYKGFPNLQKDYRLFKFVRSNLTLGSMLSYLHMDMRNYKAPDEEGGWALCSSPLRDDKNPSFGFNDTTFGCRDFTKGLSMDYGELFRELLDIKKKDLGLYNHIPTTRNEAELHCVYAAYNRYAKKHNIKFSKFPFVLKKKEESDDMKPTGKKKVIPGEQYYDTMALQFKAITRSALNKFSASYKQDYDIFIKSVIMSMPKIYYFYDYNPTFAENLMITNQEMLRLGIQHLFLTSKVTLTVPNSREVMMYVVNESNVHVPFTNFYKYNASSEEKKGIVSEIASSINHINLYGAPGLTNKSSKVIADEIYSVYFNLKDLEKDFNSHIKSEKVSMANADELLLDFIQQKYNIPFTKEDLQINVVSNNRYMQFKNYLVLYDSDDPDNIGLVVENTPKNKHDIFRSNLVDIIVPHDYVPGAKKPMFEKFLEFLDHDGNNAKKIIAYMYGSSLFRPDGTSRATMFYGMMGKNGKSVLADVTAGLYTDTYVSKLSIHELSQDGTDGKVARCKLMDKVFNISVDSSGEKLESIFKNLVSGEAVETKILYHAPRTAHMRAHYMVNINTMLRLKSGEAMPFMRRVLTVKLDRVVPKGEEDTTLATKIIENEACAIWPWIIEQAKLFKKKGLYGFLTESEICSNEEHLLVANDIYTFIEDYVKLDDKGLEDETIRLTKTQFRKYYAKWRQKIGRRAPGNETVVNEFLTYVNHKFGEHIPTEILNKGFDYRTSEGLRGIPGIYIYINKRELGSYEDINTRKECLDNNKK